MDSQEENGSRRLLYQKGRNFGADWASRADLDKIAEWSQKMGFYRARFRAR